jgi:anti-anti-sigma factor
VISSALGDGSVHILVSGEVDIATEGRFRDALAAALADQPRRIVLDLDGVTFADARLVHALEDARSTLSTDGSDLVVVRARRSVARLLAICGLAHLCQEC